MARRTSNVMDEFVAVEELHALGYKDMSNLLLEEDSPMLRLSSAKGVALTVDVEKLASCLPLHLIACVASGGEPRLRYWLRAVRLLHTLSTLALGYPKLSQVLLQEVKIRMQILDLVTYMLVVLANMEQEGRGGGFIAVLHAALVACSLYLLMAFISHDWLDIAPVLLAHPKVNVFMDASFDVVKRDITLLQVKLRSLSTKLSAKKTTYTAAERVAQVTALQCEASLQVLQHLCVPPDFRDEVIGHKELCKNGGILKLVLAVLRLQLPPVFSNSRSLQATISRSKSKALLMMLKFCESDLSFLDMVSTDSEPHIKQLAEQVAHEVLLLVKAALVEDPRLINDEEEEKKNPMGMLHVNALRLADILSDDSNFRNLVMDQIAPDLASVLAVVPTKFQERWCGGPTARELAMGELDASLIYDPFEAAGEAMAASAKANVAGSSAQEETFSPPDFQIAPPVATAHQQRAAFLVKLFANFYCFNAEVCPAHEKDRFMETFLQCLWAGPLSPNHALYFLSVERTSVRICENLHTLYDYVLTLTSDIVVDEDLVLVSEFADALHTQICPSSSVVADAPLLWFVRDGHEQKLLSWKTEREQLERWQHLEQSRQPEDSDMAPIEVAVDAVDATNATVEVEKLVEVPTPKEEEPTHIPEEVTQHVDEVAAIEVTKMEEVVDQPSSQDGTAIEDAQSKLENQTVIVKEEMESGSANVTDREDGGKGEQESGGATMTPTTRRNSRDREPHSSEHGDESQPKKRKRNIMNDKQVSVMEAALQYEPEMQRCPKAIQQWTNHLNQIGPEVAYHQLKNWLNNRKARIARQERDKQRQAEGDILNARIGDKPRYSRSAPSDDMDSPAEVASPRTKDDDADYSDLASMKSALQAPKTPSEGTISFEEAEETLVGKPRVAWDANHMVTASNPPPRLPSKPASDPSV